MEMICCCGVGRSGNHNTSRTGQNNTTSNNNSVVTNTMPQQQVQQQQQQQVQVYSTAIDNAIKKLIELNINLLAIDFDQTYIDIHTGGRYNGTVNELVCHVRCELSQLISAALQCTTHTFYVTIVTFSCQIQLIKGVLELSIGSTLLANKIPIRGNDRSWSYTGVGIREGKQSHIASAVEELLASSMLTTATTVTESKDNENNPKKNKDCTDNENENNKKETNEMKDKSKKLVVDDSNSVNTNHQQDKGQQQQATSTSTSTGTTLTSAADASTSTGSSSNNSSDIRITKATTLLIDDDRKNIRIALKDGTRAIWFNPEKPYLLLQDIAKLV